MFNTTEVLTLVALTTDRVSRYLQLPNPGLKAKVNRGLGFLLGIKKILISVLGLTQWGVWSNRNFDNRLFQSME